MPRMTKEDYFLQIAKTVGLRSTCLRARCGAIIVQKGTIISTGYNGSVRGQENCCDRGTCPRQNSKPQHDKQLCSACHAEANAITNVARNGSGSTLNSTLFVDFVRTDDHINTYNKPCDECMKLVINAGIKYIVNRNEDMDKITLDVSEITDSVVTTERVWEKIKEVPVTELTVVEKDVKS